MKLQKCYVAEARLYLGKLAQLGMGWAGPGWANLPGITETGTDPLITGTYDANPNFVAVCCMFYYITLL